MWNESVEPEFGARVWGQSSEPKSVLGRRNVEPESVLGSQVVEPEFGARVCTWEPGSGARAWR